MGALHVFEAARQSCPKAKIYHASSSELFSGDEYPQNEDTIFSPKSPYGVSKLFAHHMAHCYKNSYGMFIVCGICFNMEGPRRGIEFVTQKIVDTVVRQVRGEEIILELGNLDAKRDWSHVEDSVEGMWLMLQQDTPKDYVLASGETHSIFEFINTVYGHFGIDVIWLTKNGLPYGVDTEGKVLVKSVEKYFRPNEVHTLKGDSTRARKELSWIPEHTFSSLVADMINHKVEEYSKYNK
jgi:GDPmannose 4,6-dehydratase